MSATSATSAAITQPESRGFGSSSGFNRTGR